MRAAWSMKGITFPSSSSASSPYICTLSAFFLQKSNKEKVALSFVMFVVNSILILNHHDERGRPATPSNNPIAAEAFPSWAEMY